MQMSQQEVLTKGMNIIVPKIFSVTITHMIVIHCNISIQLLLVFRIFTKDYCIQLAKPQLDANRPKTPPPPTISAFW